MRKRKRKEKLLYIIDIDKMNKLLKMDIILNKLREHFGSMEELARLLDMREGGINKWRSRGIPKKWINEISHLSDGFFTVNELLLYKSNGISTTDPKAKARAMKLFKNGVGNARVQIQLNNEGYKNALGKTISLATVNHWKADWRKTKENKHDA